ncbi:hypothetical protein T492DRAFT_993395 [Pavlovales sp. CCMP2436]|nr:hypothetical protein T492DRAFT_993395 [Pavlovales sp. CCMP2436]
MRRMRLPLALGRGLGLDLGRARPAQRLLSTRARDELIAARTRDESLPTHVRDEYDIAPAPTYGYKSLIAAGEAVDKSRGQGKGWGQSFKEGMIRFKEGKMEDSFKQYIIAALKIDKFDLANGFKSNIEDSLKQSTFEKMRDAMPWSTKNPARAELEEQLRIVGAMSQFDNIFPLKIKAERRVAIAAAAGSSPQAVGKLVKHYFQARAIHDFIKARRRLDSPMPIDTKNLFELMRIQPSPRSYELTVQANQTRSINKRRMINFQRPSFTRS